MTEEMSAEQMRRFKDAFKLFDVNGDEKISAKELSTLMLSLGACLTQKELMDIMAELDTNNNGYIDFDEFATLMLRKEKEGYEEEEIIAAFRIFDQDDNGYIDKEELKAIMKTLGETMEDEEVETMISEADKNGDGKIQYDEFAKMMFS